MGLGFDHVEKSLEKLMVAGVHGSDYQVLMMNVYQYELYGIIEV